MFRGTSVGHSRGFIYFEKKNKQIYERSTISAFQLNFVQYTAIQQSYKLPWPSREK